MNTKTYQKGEAIFRQGDAAESMYDIILGRVGVYLDYGTEKEKKLTELSGSSFLGEMGMIDHEKRSATAVALANGTCLEEITEDDLGELLREEPARVIAVAQQLSGRLRKLTRDYMEACRTAAGAVRLEEKKAEVSPEESDDIFARAEYFSQIRSCGYDLCF